MNRLRNVNPITAAIIVAIFIVFGLVMVYWNPGAPPPQKPVDYSTNTPEPFPASTTPAVKRPVLPEAAKQFSKKGGEAFFDYFVDVYNYTMVSGDTDLINEIMQKESRFRQGLVTNVEENPAETKRTRMVADSKGSFFSRTNSTIDVTVEINELLDGKKTEPQPTTMLFMAKWIDDHWTAEALSTPENTARNHSGEQKQ